jgi:transposase-like protein
MTYILYILIGLLLIKIISILWNIFFKKDKASKRYIKKDLGIGNVVNWCLAIFAVMKCRNCNQLSCIKKGIRNGRQRYFCKSCRLSFQDNYTYKAYDENTNQWIVKLLKNSCGVMDISRILEITPKTVLSRMLKINKQIKTPYFNRKGCNYEVNKIAGINPRFH